MLDLQPLVLVLVLLLALPSQAGTLVVLSQPQVQQYELVVAGLKREVTSTRPVSVDDAAGVRAALAGNPDVVVAVGSKAFELAKAQVSGGVIIAAAVLNPDTANRKDVTAVPLEPRGSDTLNALVALAPNVKSVLVLHPPGDAQALADAREAAQKRGVTLAFESLVDLNGFQDRFRALLQGHGAVWVMPDARIVRPEFVKFMVGVCLDHRIPLFGFVEGMTRAGALASVSTDYTALGRETGRYAASLLAHGRTDRTALGFHFSSGVLSVNARTREALELKGVVPDGAVVIQ